MSCTTAAAGSKAFGATKQKRGRQFSGWINTSTGCSIPPRIYRAEIPYTKEEIEAAIKETIKANKLKACYIRPVVYRGYGDVGVSPVGCPVDVSIVVWEWGKYLGADAH